MSARPFSLSNTKVIIEKRKRKVVQRGKIFE